MRDFVLDLMEDLLHDKDLALREEDLRFYDKGTTAETDEALENTMRLQPPIFIDPGVMERLCQMAGGDVYVVFTSISDIHVHPVNGRYTLSSMRRTLTDTNRDLNQHGELLSRQIYQYSRDTKEFKVMA